MAARRAGIDAAAETAAATAAVLTHPRITWYDADAVAVAETGAAMHVHVATGDIVTADQLVLAAGGGCR